METHECGDGVDGKACIGDIRSRCLQRSACDSPRLLFRAASEQHRKFASLNDMTQPNLHYYSD